jgi:hypothetical protein
MKINFEQDCKIGTVYVCVGVNWWEWEIKVREYG